MPNYIPPDWPVVSKVRPLTGRGHQRTFVMVIDDALWTWGSCNFHVQCSLRCAWPSCVQSGLLDRLDDQLNTCHCWTYICQGSNQTEMCNGENRRIYSARAAVVSNLLRTMMFLSVSENPPDVTYIHTKTYSKMDRNCSESEINVFFCF